MEIYYNSNQFFLFLKATILQSLLFILLKNTPSAVTLCAQCLPHPEVTGPLTGAASVHLPLPPEQH